MKKFLAYVKDYKKEMILAIICIEAETAFELIIPMIMADIIDVGIANEDRSFILLKGLQMVVCAVISLFLGNLCARFTAICGNGIGASIRAAEFQKMQTYSFSNTDKFSTPSLVTRLTSDVTTIQNSITNGIRPGFRSPVMLLVAIYLSFKINGALAVVFLIASPILGIVLFFIVKNVRPLYTKMQGAVDYVNRIIQENLAAIRVVKAYVREDYEITKFEEVNQNLKNNSEKAFSLAVLNMPAFQFVMYGTILSILWFGGNLVIIGNMKVGSLTSFLSYVLQVLNSLMMFSNVFLLFTRSLTSWKRITEVLEEEPTITDDLAKEIEIKSGSISFEHVFFKYKETAQEYVLSDISFDIKPGQTIGIIGPTGSAKSTLVQLIPRLYEATSGNISIDGHPIYEFTQKHLRDSIAMVLQKNTLFSGTVRENLLWGKEDATMEEIERACRIACVDEFIDRLDNGYDTELGQGGVNVSGGQKQRLCIARAILKAPKVLILDDSTSAVDTATEAKIKEGLAKELPGMTKIIVAQRITSIMDADQILILDDGKINAVGTHKTLLKDNEIYQDIYYSQQQGGNL
ncbi:ABC transporter ATP-binding protein [Anaerocolumna aminovalerica]|jgi:ATP-binding cassette subfamily B multidrug efflux pump|uniref:ATP-binding cassette, subfamily B n=1 Tax=Anaerocolumna aminovalerica TaxID=1527 RepID=A0A1I5J4Q8_9FIRM|nr:ABC transporter ATP-binding protein [Anaerocolumna aminovalerica]MDU6266596.1 ABC transporter ATP-binding protein [Anaerocolumna aminovalerica]SFO67366.1 ATP-binding cassette, subfamily B [Anaerocolumna aminovalerica]